MWYVMLDIRWRGRVYASITSMMSPSFVDIILVHISLCMACRYLQNNNLTGTIPTEFGLLFNLRTLCASYHSFPCYCLVEMESLLADESLCSLLSYISIASYSSMETLFMIFPKRISKILLAQWERTGLFSWNKLVRVPWC